MIKTILVALDGSEHADAALQYALWLAERVRATVLGLHVIDVVSIEGSFLHDISGSLGFEPYLDFSAKMREALRERGRVLLETFNKRCAERGVPCDTTLATGIVANEICDQARVADLVVIGHRGVNEQFSTGLLGSTTESVTRKSPKPVFVSPMRFKEISRPLLAYDGSQRASAAMHAAAEVASGLSLPLTVIHVGREEAADGTRVLDEARRYLHSYGLALSCETITGYPHQRIVEFIRERGTTCCSWAPTDTRASSRWCSAARPSSCCGTAPAPCSWRVERRRWSRPGRGAAVSASLRRARKHLLASGRAGAEALRRRPRARAEPRGSCFSPRPGAARSRCRCRPGSSRAGGAGRRCRGAGGRCAPRGRGCSARCAASPSGRRGAQSHARRSGARSRQPRAGAARGARPPACA